MHRALTLASLLLMLGSASPGEADEPLPNPGGKPQADRSRIARAPDERDAALQPLVRMFGRGYNSINDTFGSDGCVHVEFNPPDTAPSNDPDIKMKLVRTATELKRETSLEASAHAEYLAFSVDATAKLQQKEATTQLTDYLIVRTIVKLPSLVTVENDITPKAKTLLQESPQAFHRICGDSFVSGINLAAEFFAVLSFESNDAKKFQEVESSLEAALGKNEIKGSFKDAIETAASKSKTEYNVFRIGGHGPLPPRDLESIIEYATKFPGELQSLSDFRIMGRPNTEYYSNIDFHFEQLPDDVIENVRVINDDIGIGVKALEDIETVLIDYQLLGIPRADRDGLHDYKVALEGFVNRMRDAKKKCGANPLLAANCQWPDNMAGFRRPMLAPEPLKVSINPASGDWQRVADTSDKPYDRRPFTRLVTQGYMCFAGWEYGCGDVNRPGFVIEVKVTGYDGRETISRYDAAARPFQLTPGVVEAHLLDSRYDDNRGTFEVILY